jgi:voltage-gated potassium channel
MVAPTSAPLLREHENAYNIFILVLTLFSLAVMVVLILPIPQNVRDLVTVYDQVICLVFLVDFVYNLTGSHPRSAYLAGARGWLDLLGSIPSFGFFQFTALLRLARLSRLVRIARMLRGENRKSLVADVIENRGQYATFITVLAAGMVLVVASILVLTFESSSPDANIKTGGDALWWGIVTITTVGYGDRFPVTLLGRLTGVSVMVAGVGIIGALASILASLLVPSPDETAAAAEAAEAAQEAAIPPAGRAAIGAEATDAILARLDALQVEVAALREESRSARSA